MCIHTLRVVSSRLLVPKVKCGGLGGETALQGENVEVGFLEQELRFASDMYVYSWFCHHGRLVFTVGRAIEKLCSLLTLRPYLYIAS